MKTLFIAEKNSQCESLMQAFEPNAIKHNGYWEGDKYIFTYAIGHLYRLKMQEFAKDINTLPYLFEPSNTLNPIDYYEAGKQTLPQLKIVNYQLSRKDIVEIVCATDPDAEGEAIYRTIIEGTDVSKSVKQSRLLIKDTTVNGLQKQFEVRNPISEYEGLRQKAYARALTDYTLGINLSQAMSIKAQNRFSVGRVQTPVLKMIIDRYNLNINFKKSSHYELSLLVGNNEIREKKLKFNTKGEANQYISTLIGNALLFEIKEKQVESSPPVLYDLADIQKYGITQLGVSANKVLDIVQSLYEKKLVTYPRTDCKKITAETAESLNVFYGGLVVEELNLNDKISQQSIGETSAHEGLTLTPQDANLEGLTKEELKIYEEIRNRFLANYLPKAVAHQLECTTEGEEMNFKGVFNAFLEKGYIKLYNDKPFKNLHSMKELEKMKDLVSEPIIITTENLIIKEVESTRPVLYTEATIISKMQNIHSEIDDDELKKVSRNIEGIGTPATRGSIIENLFKQNYIEKKGKGLIPTEKGIFLITELEKQGNPLINASYTALLEKALVEVEESKNIEEYFVGLNEFTKVVVDRVKNHEMTYEEKNYGKCPKCKKGLIVKREGKKGMFYPCSTKECDYMIPKYAKFNDKDIEQMLGGKFSGTKNLKTKEGKPYKVKFKLVGEKMEREFVNSKKK